LIPLVIASAALGQLKDPLPKAAGTIANMACTAKDFATFMQVFSESAALFNVRFRCSRSGGVLDARRRRRQVRVAVTELCGTLLAFQATQHCIFGRPV
jgi:hypothetical protein